MNPYIGITDFTDYTQVLAMLHVLKSNRKPRSNRMLHVGVMMSRKTLLGLPTKWQEIFPSKTKIAQIFDAPFYNANVYNCLHYADFGETDCELWKNLSTAIAFGGMNIHAVQLDMVWPEPAQVIEAIHVSRKKIDVILQISGKSLELANNDPNTVVSILEEYGGVVNRVLLDKSMGRGKPIDLAATLPFVRVIRNLLPQIGIGVAGGLGPDTLHLIEPLTKEYPDISIDAQCKMRPSCNTMDPIDWEIAAEYVRKACQLLS